MSKDGTGNPLADGSLSSGQFWSCKRGPLQCARWRLWLTCSSASTPSRTTYRFLHRSGIDSGQLDYHLADVLTLKEADESAHGLLDAVHDRFLVLELSSLEVGTDFFFELTLTVQRVAHDQPLHRQALGNNVEEIGRSSFPLVAVVA